VGILAINPGLVTGSGWNVLEGACEITIACGVKRVDRLRR